MGIKTLVTIDTKALGIDWIQGTDYRIEAEEGFIVEDGGESQPSPANTNLFSFTTNASGPTYSSSIPANNGTNIVNNTTITLAFNRAMSAGVGDIKLFKTGDVLVRTFDQTNSSQVTYSGHNVILNVTGYLQANTHYYLTVASGALTDADGFDFTGITNSTTVNYTTANATFPDLASTLSCTASESVTARVILYADRYLSPAEADFYYVEDTANVINGAPQVADFNDNPSGSGSYTLTITPSTTSAVSTLSTSGAGSISWNNVTKVLTLVGTRDQVNNLINNVLLTPATDYASDFTLSYQVTTPASATMTKVQNIKINTPYDIEITNMIGVGRSYLQDQENYIFASTTPTISDFDTSNPTYTIALSSSLGGFSSNINGSDYSTNWTFTGTRSACNAKFSQIIFWPTKGTSSTGTFNYTQTKGSTQQLYVSLALTGTAQSVAPEYLTFNSTTTWTPSFKQLRYNSTTVDAIIVGGGGGGVYGGIQVPNSGGGGGGGGVRELTNQTINNTAYNITVGTGGAGGTYSTVLDSTSKGKNGTTSTVFTISANGGSGGGQNSNNYGGTSGSPTAYAGGYNSSTSFGEMSGGGGGAGAAGGNSKYTSNSSDPTVAISHGGYGGAGKLSTINGLYYGGGGGGGGGQYVALSGDSSGIPVGGAGGGGTGGYINESTNIQAAAGTANTGGGGGGGHPSALQAYRVGGAGANGVVILKLRYS